MSQKQYFLGLSFLFKSWLKKISVWQGAQQWKRICVGQDVVHGVEFIIYND
jgi:hypothetical protein